MAQSYGINQSPINAPDGHPTDMSFDSKAFSAFFKHIEARSATRILDIGPVCGDNINLLAQLVHQLYICDMFTRLGQWLKNDHSSGHVWQYLDYAPDTFDGILLWDLADRMSDNLISGAGKKCWHILKPGGIVMACASGEKENHAGVRAFVLANDLSISFRNQAHLDLPLYTRKTREIIDTMAPLKLVQSSLFRNGLREFIFKKN